MPGKRERYRALVASRKACDRCPGLVNPAIHEQGRLDSDEIGPYANWQGNLDSPVVVVGQDFADQDRFIDLQGWPGAAVPTNQQLIRLAAAAGFKLESPVHGAPDDVLFFTNAVLCLKRGGMSARVPSRCFKTCGKHFLLDTVRIVNPRAVITLGIGALRGLEHAFGLKRHVNLKALVNQTPAFWLPSGAAVFPRYHPSPTVLNTLRSSEAQLEDWKRIGKWLNGDVVQGSAVVAGSA